jgi:hypothetical protein
VHSNEQTVCVCVSGLMFGLQNSSQTVCVCVSGLMFGLQNSSQIVMETFEVR